MAKYIDAEKRLEDRFNKSMEEAAEEYEWSNVDTNQLNPPTLDMTVQVGDLRDAFKAGAEWQKQKDAEELEDLATLACVEGIELGKQQMKEQMLKDAVEGYVNYYEDSGGILMAEAQVGCPYHNGDKVRIIVLKEEK